MESKKINGSEDFDNDDDVLSLRNLSIHGYQHEDVSRRGSTSDDQQLFEFFGGFGSQLSRSNSLVFCGKIIDQSYDDNDEDRVNEYRKRDYLCLKSSSFHKARDSRLDGGELRSVVSENRSRSPRFSGSEPFFHPKQTSPAVVQKVNITAITAMSEKSRRRMFMFGPVKFEPEMDVSAIRMRKSRRAPMQIPPLPEGYESVTPRAGGRGKSSGGVGGAGSAPVRPLWCRSHLATALAKSLGCISDSSV